MTRKERWQLLAIWFFLGLVPLFMRPLWEPDEARYAEIPREMLALGDWLTPRLNYVVYFEKPPLQYWLSAASMRMFGLQPFAARLPLALAAPALVGMTLICSLPWAWGTPRLRSALVRTLLDPLGWLLFLAVTLPWFVLVDRANPGQASFFFIHEHFARFTSHVHSRQGSNNPVLDKLYFVGVLALGLIPWLSSAVSGLRRGFTFLKRPAGPRAEQAPLHRWTVAATLLACAWPLFFYSISGSKLPPYILPVVVPMLAMACAFEREGGEFLALARSGWELVGLGVAFLLASPFLVKGSAAVGWVLAVGAGFVALGCWALRPRGLTGIRWMAGLGALLLLVTFAAGKVAGPGKDASALVKAAPGNAQWISCGNYFQAIPFISGQRAVVVAGAGELSYGRDRLPPRERDRWFQEDERDFNPMALRLRAEDPSRPVWALVDRNAWKDLPAEQKAVWTVKGRSPSCFLVTLQ